MPLTYDQLCVFKTLQHTRPVYWIRQMQQVKIALRIE